MILKEAHDQNSVLKFVVTNSNMLKLESHNNTKSRAEGFKLFLKEFQDGGSVAVVGHKNLFTFLNATEFKEKVEK
jgi:hypothetical protein